MIAGGEQHVPCAVGETDHRLVHLGGFQLAVRHRDGEIRDQLLEALAQGLDILDPRANHEALAAAAVLAHQGLAHRVVVEGSHYRPHRLAQGRRGREHAEALQAHEGRLQGPRDRRGCEREDVAAGREPAQVRLHLGAEALLLVDHREAEIGVGDAVAGQRMGCRPRGGSSRPPAPASRAWPRPGRRGGRGGRPRCRTGRSAAPGSPRVGAPARWSGRSAPLACRRRSQPPAPAGPPRSCRNRHRRRPAGPSVRPRRGPPSPPRRPEPDPVSARSRSPPRSVRAPGRGARASPRRPPGGSWPRPAGCGRCGPASPPLRGGGGPRCCRRACRG